MSPRQYATDWLPCSSCGVTVPPELLTEGRCSDTERCARWGRERKANERRIRAEASR